MAENGVKLRNSSRRRSKGPQNLHHDVRCVVLGDGDVGKSAMLVTYLLGHFPQEIPPGPIDGLSEYDHLTRKITKLQQDNVEVSLSLVDTFGLDEYEKLRERVCASADVYLLCFDTGKRSTFERIRHQWLIEMRRYSSAQTPFVVVGLKTDIRTKAEADGSDITKFVTYSEGMREAADLGAAQYTECSAKNNTGVKRVFEKVAQAAVENNMTPEMKRTSCVLS
ncbi:ras-related c3 botulinum toxin substrate 1 [Plakobranchus ocellatus]|uniref:Ras-related c3 botulinum toxin substrate 1 n=1 Tax=Plakobranchus ocellatus TaxID=259542 RepID=A0AAV4BD71_9GAST|nr:ras-related c3 botulinum toxin substrate 1 [Plakobranchus ocellatus]